MKPTRPDDEAVRNAFLAFIRSDMDTHPERLQLLSAGLIADAVELTDGIVVGDEEILPDDVMIEGR
jgi:hypothetical protein